MELGLEGKVALVTGASRGIGAAICRQLSDEGMHLCLVARDLVARDLAALADVAASLGNRSAVGVRIHPADLRSPEVPQQVVGATIAEFGRLDLLVNAGATKRGDFFALTDGDWAYGFAFKFHGYVRMTRAAWPHLRQSNGSIVNIVGIDSRAGSGEFTIGGSVNAALLNFTKAMADLGIEQGVRVNAINPGLVETDRFGRNIERVMRERSLDRDAAGQFLLQSHATRRIGQPEEIAALTSYLVSRKADFIQGALIDIDGGATRSI